MPGKAPMDENIRFLYSCLIRSDFKAIDFNQVGADFDINPPAARMRWARLRRNIATTSPFKDDPNSAATPTGKRKGSGEDRRRQGKKTKYMVTKEELCGDDDDLVKTETKQEFGHTSYGDTLDKSTVNGSYGGSHVCLPNGQFVYGAANFEPNQYQHDIPIDPQLSSTLPMPRTAFAPIRLTGIPNPHTGIQQTGPSTVVIAASTVPSPCTTVQLKPMNPTYSIDQDPTQARGDGADKSHANANEPAKGDMMRVAHVPETGRNVNNAIPVLVENRAARTSAVRRKVASVLTVTKPSADDGTFTLTPYPKSLGVGVQKATAPVPVSSETSASSPPATEGNSTSFLATETTFSKQSHAADIRAMGNAVAAPQTRTRRTRPRPKRYYQEGVGEGMAAIDRGLGIDGDDEDLEDDDTAGGDDEEWSG